MIWVIDFTFTRHKGLSNEKTYDIQAIFFLIIPIFIMIDS